MDKLPPINPNNQQDSDLIGNLITRMNSKKTNSKIKRKFYNNQNGVSDQDIFKKGIINIWKNKQKKEKEKVENEPQKENQSLFKQIHLLTKEQRMLKAQRHLMDAFQFRPPRNDIEYRHSFIRKIYDFQNNAYWHMILDGLSWLYIFITFFEPENRFAPIDIRIAKSVFSFEGIIVAFFQSDMILELIHLRQSDQAGFLFIIKKNYNFQAKLLCNPIILADYVFALCNYPNPTVRFGRIFRTCINLTLIFLKVGPCCYSREIRRIIESIMLSSHYMLVVIVFLLFIIFFFAILAQRIIGDLNGEQPYDKYANNFDSYLTAFITLYTMNTIDLYPEGMIPALQYSYIYLIFFLPYVLLFMFLFFPIPMAVLYNSFKEQRVKVMIHERLKQREALMLTFICTDYEKKQFISETDFLHLMEGLYGDIYDETQMIRLFQMVDDNANKKLSIDEFFEIVDLIERNDNLSPFLLRTLPTWQRFRNYMNEKVKIQRLLYNPIFTIVMLIVTLSDCIFMFISIFTDSLELEYILDILSKSFIPFYLTEIVLKMTHFGLRNFFEDGWNTFDMILLQISLIFDLIIIEVVIADQMSSFEGLFTLTKLKQIFRLIRVFRSTKMVNFFFIGFPIFSQVKELILKIFLCIPYVIRLLTIMFIVQYQFAVIGVEVFHGQNYTGNNPYKKVKCDLSDLNKRFHYFDWTMCEVAQLNSVWGQMLLQIQILTGTGWTYMLYEGVESTGSLFYSMIYFVLFHLVAQIVLSSLIKGLIWDIFSIVDKEYVDEDQENIKAEEKKKEQKQQLNLNTSRRKIFPDNPIIESQNEDNEEYSMIDAQDQVVEESQDVEYKITNLSQDEKELLFTLTPAENKTNNILSELFVRLKEFLKEQRPMIKQCKDYNYNIHLLDMELLQCRQFYKQIVEDIQSKLRQSDQKHQPNSGKSSIFMNQKVVMKKAFMSGANIKEIKKQERDIFIHMYGSEYELLREQNIMHSVMKQNEALAYLSSLLKGLFLPVNDFWNLFLIAENSIQKLLGPQSIVKFIFQNKFGFWLSIKVDDDSGGLCFRKFNDICMNSIDKSIVKDGINVSINTLRSLEGREDKLDLLIELNEFWEQLGDTQQCMIDQTQQEYIMFEYSILFRVIIVDRITSDQKNAIEQNLIQKLGNGLDADKIQDYIINKSMIIIKTISNKAKAFDCNC